MGAVRAVRAVRGGRRLRGEGGEGRGEGRSGEGEMRVMAVRWEVMAWRRMESALVVRARHLPPSRCHSSSTCRHSIRVLLLLCVQCTVILRRGSALRTKGDASHIHHTPSSSSSFLHRHYIVSCPIVIEIVLTWLFACIQNVRQGGDSFSSP